MHLLTLSSPCAAEKVANSELPSTWLHPSRSSPNPLVSVASVNTSTSAASSMRTRSGSTPPMASASFVVPALSPAVPSIPSWRNRTAPSFGRSPKDNRVAVLVLFDPNRHLHHRLSHRCICHTNRRFTCFCGNSRMPFGDVRFCFRGFNRRWKSPMLVAVTTMVARRMNHKAMQPRYVEIHEVQSAQSLTPPVGSTGHSQIK